MHRYFPIVVVLAMATAACSGGESGPPLSAQAERGKAVAQEEGCVACHGDRGQGTVGPPWIGLAGSTVTLEDGTSVVADRDYLRRSITEPGSQRKGGYTLEMPVVDLTPEQVADVIAYIEELG